MPEEHLELPSKTFLLCGLCFVHAENEEEIFRHLQYKHPQHTQYHDNVEAYQLSRRVPETIAIALLGRQKMDLFKYRDWYTGINTDPQTPLATLAEVRTIFARRGMPLPSWVASQQLAQGHRSTIPVRPLAPPAAIVLESAFREENDEHSLGNNKFLMTSEPVVDMAQLSRTSSSDESDEDEDEADVRPPPEPRVQEVISPKPNVKTLPSIATESESFWLIPQELHASDDEDTYECQACGGIRGNLRSIFDHFNKHHNMDLRNHFHKVYTGNYLRKLAICATNNRKFISSVRSLRIDIDNTMNPANTDPRKAQARSGGCYICDDFTATNFWTLDRHFVEEHPGAREENEISRHYRTEHQGTHPQFVGKVPYHLCRIVPENIAVDLAGQRRIDQLNNKVGANMVNRAPKAPYASNAEIVGMYTQRNMPVPASVATLAWPPVGVPLPAALPAPVPVPGPGPINPFGQLPAQHGPTGMFAAIPFGGFGQVQQNTAVGQATGNNDEEEDDDEEDSDENFGDDADNSARGANDTNTYLPPIQTGPGQIDSVEDPFVEDGERDYICHVHLRADPARSLIRGNFATMWDHFNQWHPEVLRANLRDEYDARYIHRLAASSLSPEQLADATAPIAASNGGSPSTGPQTLACYLCDDFKADSFEEMDGHFMSNHQDERYEIATDLFKNWSDGQGL